MTHRSRRDSTGQPPAATKRDSAHGRNAFGRAGVQEFASGCGGSMARFAQNFAYFWPALEHRPTGPGRQISGLVCHDPPRVVTRAGHAFCPLTALSFGRTGCAEANQRGLCAGRPAHRRADAAARQLFALFFSIGAWLVRRPVATANIMTFARGVRLGRFTNVCRLRRRQRLPLRRRFLPICRKVLG